MLHLQARDVDNADLTGHLQRGLASDRAAIARAHDQSLPRFRPRAHGHRPVYRSGLQDLDTSVAQCDIHTDVERGSRSKPIEPFRHIDRQRTDNKCRQVRVSGAIGWKDLDQRCSSRQRRFCYFRARRRRRAACRLRSPPSQGTWHADR